MRFFLRNASRKFLLLLTVVLFISIGLFGQAGLNQTTQYVPNRVIVKFKSGGDATAVAQFKAQLKNSLGVSKTKRWNKIDAELWQFTRGNVEDVIARWKNDPRIKYIEPDYIVHASVVPNDPQYGNLWGMAKIQAAEAWDTTTGAAVIVGVIDTGVDYLHPDLAANIWTNPGEIPGNGIDDDNNGYIDDVHGYDFINNDGDPMDDHNHGTHCAGTIAGVGNNGIGVVGINWTAKIMALKFLGANGSGNTSDAISAELYATAMGAKLTSNSWGGGGYSQALYDAINAAATANCLFVAAAGNDNSSFIDYPAGYDLDNVISVAATDINDARASFSNYGATWVDLGAPGVGIISTTRNNTYSSFSGTSMACPHVAGAAALIWARAPLLSWVYVKDMILSSVDPVASLAGITVTGGRLNLFKAIVATGVLLRSAEPVISVSPPSVSFSILPDANSNSLLSISNTDVDARKLDWNITSSACSWLSINILSGRVVGGGTQQIQFTADAFGMAPGNYQCIVNINSNDPVNPVVQVIVNLEVLYAPPPVASVSPPSISLALTIGESADNIVTVSNIAGVGERNLHWSAVKQGSSAWLTLTNNSATTAAGASSQMHVLSNAAGLSAGVYNETINITTNDPNNVLIQIPIQLTVSSEPISGQKIYTFGGNGNTIRRANLDGSNAATPFTGLGRPANGVVDVVNRKLYWADWNPMSIKRANLDGSNNETLVTTISGAIITIDLDVANNHMYFFHQVAAQVFRLSRANLDGSNLITVGDVPGWNFDGLTIDHANNKLYWLMLGASANGGHTETGIWRSNLDLTNKEHLVTPPADAMRGLSLDLAGGKMYWGETYPRDVIRTATLDGNNQADVLVGYEPLDVAVDPIGGKIYWTQQLCVGFNCTYDTRRVDLNGSNFQSLGLDAYKVVLDLSGASELTINDVTQNELNTGTSNFTFTVSLSSPAPAGGVTFDIATADNTATIANNDYVQKSLTGQTIPAGSSTYTFDVVVNGDATIEPTESFFVNVTNVIGATVSDGQGAGTITNDDFPAATSLTLSNPNPTCAASPVSFTATLTRITTPVGPLAGQLVTFTLTNPGAVVISTLTATTDVNGDATVIFGGASFTAAGAYTVQASFAGSALYLASSSPVITHVVSTAPAFSICPSNQSVNALNNSCSNIVTYTATASGTPDPTITYAFSGATTGTGNGTGSGSSFNVGVTTVTLTATNGCGNAATCSFTVTVNDNTPPSITCPANITVNNATNQCGAVVTYAATATDNCSGTTIGYSPASGSFFPVGTTTVTATATDAAGHTASCTFTVTVVDAQNPTITCPANITRNNDANQCGAVVTYAATATDNCPGTTIGYSPASGSFFPVGTTTVTATATDGAGHTASCTFTVTVADAQNPSITCPANITVNNATNQCGAVVTYAATASDNCPGVSVSYSPASGSFFPAGTTTVTATATDAVGHTSSCTFTVTVVDAQNPTISCPANITVNNTANQCGANVSYPAATASDNCPGVSVSYSAASGSFFPVGTTTVTATATDAAGHTASCTFTVTVIDAQNPTITCPANITVNNATGLCGANVTFSATASDNCPGTIVSYSKAPGSFFNVGTTTVTATATDAAGHAATCTFTVKVVDTQGPTITCPANITQIITSGCSKKLTPPNPTVNDNCGVVSSLTWYMTGATTGNSSSSGINYVGSQTFNTGVTTITYTAKDIYGNTSVCSFTVAILETVPPSITCPPNKTVSTDYGYCYWSHVNLGTPRVSDNCGVADVTNDAPDVFPIGTTVVTWTVTDNSGNTKSCTQTITVLDTQNPSVTCPANIYQNASAGCITTVTAPDPTYYDNCTVAKLTWAMTGATTGSSPTTGINFVGTKNYNVGTTTITYTIKDAANNSWSCSFAVTITDVTNPTITCPANITQTAAAGACSRSIAVPDPTYSDNCGVTKLTWYMEGVTNASSPTSGINKVGTKTFNAGVTTVTYTAWDPWGNSKQCSFTVTVTDNQPPVATCPAAQTLCKKSNNTYTIPTLTSNDNCSVTGITYQVTGVTTRSGTGSNASGLFNPGLSTITWTVTDASGNTTSCSTNVTIVPAGNCRIVSNDPKDNPQSPDTKLPKEKLDVAVSNSQLEVTAYPNPTDYYFNVKVKSASKDAVEIKMYDGLGKVVQQDKGAPDQTYRFGDHVVGGIYFIEVRQAGQTAIIKVMKQ